MKRCSICGLERPHSDFYGRKGNKDGLRSECKECSKAHRTTPIEANRRSVYAALYGQTFSGHTRRRAAFLKHKYGITLEKYDCMLQASGGGCESCGSKETGSKSPYFHVDHDHGTGDIRGLLCRACNTGAGIQDNPDLLMLKIKYLEKYGKKLS